MSTIQNLKNFIRHGKQARDAKSPPDQPAVSNIHAQQQRYNDYQAQPRQPQAPQQAHFGGVTDPNLYGHKPVQHDGGHRDFSAAAVDNRNVAAQAGHAAAHAADQQRRAEKAKAQGGKNVDKDVLERIVAEEREAKGRLPRYPGLERYQLIEKMGDGAFSNVYRARDLKGVYQEVAIKVVRKFEMNATQVRIIVAVPIHLLSDSSSFFFW